MEQQKFYQKTWFIILLLILFFPVGLFLMWKYKPFNKVARIIITVVIAILVVYVIVDPPAMTDVADKNEKQAEEHKNSTNNPSKFILGDTYDDEGLLVTITDVANEGEKTKATVEFENTSDKTVGRNMNNFRAEDIDEGSIMFSSSGTAFESGGIDIEPGQQITEYLFFEKADIAFIDYIGDGSWKDSEVTWNLKTKADFEEAEKTREKVRDTARARAATYFPFPDTVDFPALDFVMESQGDGYFEGGKLSYKNVLGEKVKGNYKMRYAKDDKLTQLELDGTPLI